MNPKTKVVVKFNEHEEPEQRRYVPCVGDYFTLNFSKDNVCIRVYSDDDNIVEIVAINKPNSTWGIGYKTFVEWIDDGKLELLSEVTITANR
jgi:hypothetical protein